MTGCSSTLSTRRLNCKLSRYVGRNIIRISHGKVGHISQHGQVMHRDAKTFGDKVAASAVSLARSVLLWADHLPHADLTRHAGNVSISFQATSTGQSRLAPTCLLRTFSEAATSSATGSGSRYVFSSLTPVAFHQHRQRVAHTFLRVHRWRSRHGWRDAPSLAQPASHAQRLWLDPYSAGRGRERAHASHVSFRGGESAISV